MVAPGAQERFLAAGELLGSFLLNARAPGVVGRAEGAEVGEALRGLRHPRLEEGEVARETGQASPQRR